MAVSTGLYYLEKKKNNRAATQKKAAPTPTPVEKEVDKETKQIVEKKSSIAITDIQNEIPLTVNCLTVSRRVHSLVDSNCKELSSISDLGDDPHDYAICMRITIPNLSKNIRGFSSCRIYKTL